MTPLTLESWNRVAVSMCFKRNDFIKAAQELSKRKQMRVIWGFASDLHCCSKATDYCTESPCWMHSDSHIIGAQTPGLPYGFPCGFLHLDVNRLKVNTGQVDVNIIRSWISHESFVMSATFRILAYLYISQVASLCNLRRWLIINKINFWKFHLPNRYYCFL